MKKARFRLIILTNFLVNGQMVKRNNCPMMVQKFDMFY